MNPELSGAAEWVRYGLLGAVLWWVFFRHLPAQAKQFEKFLESKAAETVTLVREHRENVTAQREEFLRSLAQQRADHHAAQQVLASTCEREIQHVASSARDFQQTIGSALSDISKAVAEVLLRQQREH